MKVNELMLGDWVTLDGIPVQVTMISSEGVVMILQDVQLIYTNSERLNPIPLTGELLKLNDFNYSHANSLGPISAYEIKIDETNCFILDVINKQFYVPFHKGVVEINYIHELQHYLQLIGLSELTNNFKIK